MTTIVIILRHLIFFSGIDEEPSSFEDSEYDGYYYTSDTGSSYSGYSDDDFSVTEDK